MESKLRDRIAMLEKEVEAQTHIAAAMYKRIVMSDELNHPDYVGYGEQMNRLFMIKEELAFAKELLEKVN